MGFIQFYPIKNTIDLDILELDGITLGNVGGQGLPAEPLFPTLFSETLSLKHPRYGHW